MRSRLLDHLFFFNLLNARIPKLLDSLSYTNLSHRRIQTNITASSIPTVPRDTTQPASYLTVTSISVWMVETTLTDAAASTKKRDLRPRP